MTAPTRPAMPPPNDPTERVVGLRAARSGCQKRDARGTAQGNRRGRDVGGDGPSQADDRHGSHGDLPVERRGAALGRFPRIRDDARVFASDLTILNGDLGIRINNNDNSYHKVTAHGAGLCAVLDGFTITGGNRERDRPT